MLFLPTTLLRTLNGAAGTPSRAGKADPREADLWEADLWEAPQSSATEPWRWVSLRAAADLMEAQGLARTLK